MAEKLKSALKIIHWSLAFKAILAGLVWIYFPWWISIFVLLGIYFVPLFQTRYLFVPFLMTLVLGWILPSNLFSGLIVALQVYLILGIKDFIFINRRGAMQVLSALFLAEAGVAIYFSPDNWLLSAFVYSCLFGLVYYLVSSKLLDVSPQEVKEGDKSTITIFTFLLAQAAFALNFLPISYLYKSLLLILGALIFFEWQNFIISNELSRNKIISYGMFFVGLLVLIFSGISWGL